MDDLDELEVFLAGTLQISKEEIESCLEWVCSEEKENVKCDIHMVKCTAERVREQEFIKIIGNYLIFYALRVNEYSDIDPKNAVRIVRLAKNRFASRNDSGEVGELIIFIMLELYRGATQILNKMSIKTNGEMNFHGLDGVHLSIQDGNVRLYYGHSKFYKEMKGAIRDSVKDINEFNEDSDKQEFEINLVDANIDTVKFGQYTEEIKKIINPWAEDKTNFSEIHSVFIGCEWSSLAKIDYERLRKEGSAYLKSIIESEKADLVKYCRDKVSDNSIQTSVEFFIIPFLNKNRVNTLFQEVLS